VKKAVAAGIGIFLVIGIVVGVAGFVGRWWDRGVEVVSPENVTEQHRGIIQQWESMKVSASNACSAVQQSEGNSKSPTMVEDVTLAYAATFRNSVAEYQRRMDNLFEAKIVAPPGYPTDVPFTDLGPNTDWCQVYADLAAIK